jgi:imidazole glycerol phosphate synthase glutamine amidotransferase subunit
VPGSAVRVAVVDHGAGNLVSVREALEDAGAEVSFLRGPEGLAEADGLLVPGVGAAAPAMTRLRRQGLVGPIRAWAAAGRPLLGVCLGLQLLMDGSDEDGARTLALIPGRTTALTGAPRLPHMGWNQAELTRDDPLFTGVRSDEDFYFVHSYAARPGPGADGVTLATTVHGDRFVSAVALGSVRGVQFHPERSGRAGRRVIANWVGLVRDGRRP